MLVTLQMLDCCCYLKQNFIAQMKESTRLPIVCSLHTELEDCVGTGYASRNGWYKCHVPTSPMEKRAVSNKQDSDLSLAS